MNPPEMVVLIVAIVMAANVLKGRRLGRRREERLLDVTPDADNSDESHKLRGEVQQLKQRIQVLERITVEKENSLAREIEQLRDH